MYMFTPEIHRYYLAAFIIVSIKHPDAADEIPDLIIFHLSDCQKPFWKKRVSNLTLTQREVVAEFIVEVSDEYHREVGMVDSGIRGLEVVDSDA